MEVEGRKRDKYWTFSVIDQSGLSLLRMSTQNEKDAESWVQVNMLLTLKPETNDTLRVQKAPFSACTSSLVFTDKIVGSSSPSPWGVRTNCLSPDLTSHARGLLLDYKAISLQECLNLIDKCYHRNMNKQANQRVSRREMSMCQ